MSDPSQLCKVTNQSGNDAVVMIPTTSTPTSTSGDIVVYNQSLAVLATVEGGTIINNTATGTVTLDQTYIDPTTKAVTPSILYELLICDASWYSPVANLSVMQSFTSPGTYAPQTATSAEAKSLSDAGSFIQTTQAYPRSKLTTDYQAALTGASSSAKTAADGSSGSAQATSDSITDTTNTFFQSTEGYKGVTLAAVVAMQSYYANFPFVWAQYSASAVTYYLYGNDIKTKTTTFEGTMVLTPPKTIDLSKVNGGYIVIFNPAKTPADTSTVDVDTSKAVALTYDNGLFVDQPGGDIQNIAVKGMFMLKRNLTLVQTDISILPVITGTTYGVTALGFNSPQLSTSANDEFWDALFDPKTSSQVFQSIMTLGGAVMMLHFAATSLWGIGKWMKEKIAGSKDTKASATKDDLKEADEAQKPLSDQMDADVKAISDGTQTAPDSLEDAQSTIDEASGSLGNNMNAGQIGNGLEAQAKSAETLEQYASEMTTEQMESLESVATNVKSTSEDLNTAVDSQEDLGTAVDTAQKSMLEINTSSSQLADDLGTTISTQEADQIKANEAATTEASETVDEMQESSEKETTDDDPIADDPIEVP
jgi:hypothetical protein